MKAPGDFRGEAGGVRDAAHAEQDYVQPACPGGQLPGGEHGEGGTDLRRGPAGEDGGWGHIRLGLHGAGRGLTQISIAIDSDLKQNGQPPLEQNWGIYKPIRREGELERKRTKEARLLRPRLSKNPWRAREGQSPLEFQSCPAACTVGTGGFLRRKIPFFQSKNRFLAVFAPGNLKDFSKNW